MKEKEGTPVDNEAELKSRYEHSPQKQILYRGNQKA
jgi:hypothetical protein